MGALGPAPPEKPDVQQITRMGAPDWTSAGPIPTVLGNDPDPRVQAKVMPGSGQITVTQPNAYTPPMAAHEATHEFQDTRNGDFQRGTNALLADRSPQPSDYDYGGVAGVQAHPMKSVAQYNPEQQAMMVEDLTKAQDALPAHPTRPQLQAWDNTKNTLERPIQQLKSVPAADTSLAGRADEWLASRANPVVAGMDHPFTRLKGLFSPPTMPTAPEPGPEAPSVALGYANRSRLVK